MPTLRLWSVRHARLLQACYALVEHVLVALHPIWRRIGYARIEPLIAKLEYPVKSLLFDCRMCGQCVLSSTGMSCPMNCPKHLRNGPCGGVRGNSNCEVKEEMKCVWVEAVLGSQQMNGGLAAIQVVQKPLDGRMQGRSSWLAVAQAKACETRGSSGTAK